MGTDAAETAGPRSPRLFGRGALARKSTANLRQPLLMDAIQLAAAVLVDLKTEADRAPITGAFDRRGGVLASRGEVQPRISAFDGNRNAVQQGQAAGRLLDDNIDAHVAAPGQIGIGVFMNEA